MEGEVMANNENLRPVRTKSEARERGRNGGQASGKSRRRKAAFRENLNLLLTLDIDDDEWAPLLRSLGLECTLETALNMAMIKEGLAGNVKAYEAVAKYSGQSAQTEADEEEQLIRTERAKRARDMEIGNADNTDENIHSFLKAMRPTQEELDALLNEESGDETEDAEEAEETSDI